MANWRFNADANTGHAFGIFMASVGTLRASRFALRAPAPVNFGVRLFSCAAFEVTLCSTYGMQTARVSATHNVREQ